MKESSMPQDVLNPATGDEILEGASDGAGDSSGDVGAGGGDGADQAVAEEASVEKLRQLMVKRGISDVGKLAEMYSGLERDNTVLRQDVSRLSAVGRFPAAGVGAGGAVAGGDDDDFEIPEKPIELLTDPATLKKFAKSMREAGRQAARQEIQSRDYGTMQAQVQAKMADDPVMFKKLRPYMIDISRERQGLDINQLYQLAEAEYKADRTEQLVELKRELGLNDDAGDKLKGIIGRVRQAPISSGTGQQVRPAAGTKNSQEDADLLKAIMDADKF